jgi:hypothetical protein
MRITIIFTGALLVAACGGQQAETANEAEPATTQATENAVASLPEGERNAVFIRAIRDSSDAGQVCQHVASSERVGEIRGDPVWRAHCDDGSSWTIVLSAPDTAQVINDAEARLAGVNLTAPAENETAPVANTQGQ